MSVVASILRQRVCVIVLHKVIVLLSLLESCEYNKVGKGHF
jgi:hypothetical protein